MNLTCYIVDDELHAIEVLKTFIQDTPGLTLSGYHTDPRSALADVTGPTAPDVTFLDIDMPGLSGMQFAGLAALHTEIIFTTSYMEYAVEAFEKEAFDYLLKPIAYERFLKTIQKLKKYHQKLQAANGTPEDSFYVRSDIKGKLVRIVTEDIYYIEAALNYITIHFVSGKQMVYLTMEEIAEKLPDRQFIRVHRSFIINLGKIKWLEPGQVVLNNLAITPVGRTYKDKLLEDLDHQLLKSKRSPR